MEIEEELHSSIDEQPAQQLRNVVFDSALSMSGPDPSVGSLKLEDYDYIE